MEPPSALDLHLRGIPELSGAVKGECPTCHKKRLLYCADCAVAVTSVNEATSVMSLPRVRLPLRLHILRGKEETPAKSTATHAAVLAPEDTTIYSLPDFPKYDDPKRVLLLFPSPKSCTVRQLPDLDAFDTVLVVDTTWQKAGSVLLMPEVVDAPFTHVAICDYRTLFWRYQPIGPHCVSTIEASYFLLREYDVEVKRRASSVSRGSSAISTDSITSADPDCVLYDGRFDGLLTLFLDNYNRIQREYQVGRAAALGRTFTTKHRPGYIIGAPSASATARVAVDEKENNKRGGDESFSVAAASERAAARAVAPLLSGELSRQLPLDAVSSKAERSATEVPDELEDVSAVSLVAEAAVASIPALHLRKRRRAPRVRGAWAVRADIMDAEPAAMSRSRIERLISNTWRQATPLQGSEHFAATRMQDDATAMPQHEVESGDAAASDRGGTVASTDTSNVASITAQSEVLAFERLQRIQQKAYGMRRAPS